MQTQGAASAQVLQNLNFRDKQSGFQDISAYVKYKMLDKPTARGSFSLVGAFGVKTPSGNYRVDEGFQSIVAIGNRATSLNTLMIGLLKDDSGFFASGQVGYCVRNKQMPDAVMSEFKISLTKPCFYADFFVANQTSLSGTDILAEGFQGFFPSMKVNYTRLGVNLFVPIFKQFGLCTGGSTYVNGRNLGQSTSLYAALSVSF